MKLPTWLCLALSLAGLITIGIGIHQISAQTSVPEDQIRLKIRVVEWQKCTWTSPDGKTSCVGLEFYRFLMQDGSIRGPFIAAPAGPDFVLDPTKWQKATQ